MSSFTQAVPATIAPYFSNLSKHSLLLFTYILGASANWLLLRLLHASLKSSSNQQNESPTGVILISFLRDYLFWRDATRKLGLDITKLAAQNRFLCVDGLSELFTSGTAGKAGVQGDHVVLKDASLKSIESTVFDLIKRMNAATPDGKTILIVDGLDFVMAANEDTSAETANMIMEWRRVSSYTGQTTSCAPGTDNVKHVHSMAVTASADSPLIHMGEQQTPLETNHLAHVVGLGHQANVIMGLRGLDTGTAKDVSGVLRISRGAMASEEVRDHELLYFVGGDGGVKIFERGA